jgi:hypothetical protein
MWLVVETIYFVFWGPIHLYRDKLGGYSFCRDKLGGNSFGVGALDIFYFSGDSGLFYISWV